MSINTVIVELPRAGAIFTKLGFDGFFWSDSHSILDYGPFPTVHAAMENYTNDLKTRVASIKRTPAPLPSVPEDNVIMVDFKNKRRVA